MKKAILSLIVLYAQTVRRAGLILDNITNFPVCVRLNPLDANGCVSIHPVTILVPPQTAYGHPGTPGIRFEVAYIMDNLPLFATIAIPIEVPGTGTAGWGGIPGQPTTTCVAGVVPFAPCGDSSPNTDCNGLLMEACWDGTAALPVIRINN